MADASERAELPKAIKRALRELVGCAHEAALRRALTDLRREFDAWERGEIDAFELKERIHKFHQGPAREICLRFNGGIDLRLLAGYCVHEGLIEKESIPAEVLPYLESSLSFYREIS
jgi:hypothetical protein